MVGPLRAGMLESAWRARELLGPETWAQVLRIELVRPGSGRDAVVHAVVFELEDRLWYYAENLGTQSLSLLRGHLAQDKADLRPLLQEIEPGLGRYEVLEAGPDSRIAARERGELPQGCFIECVAYLQGMIKAGRAPEEARLVASYPTMSGDSRGHTLLYFTREGRRYYYDPAFLAEPRLIPAFVPTDALEIAGWAAPKQGVARPRRAVFFSLRLPAAENSARTNRRLVAGSATPKGQVAPVMSQ